jgi:hypothetical protein
MGLPFDQPLLIALAVVVAVFGVGRLSRILTYDDFPPAAWARDRWDRLTRDGSWSKLAHCQWCATPWIMAGCIAWAWLSGLHWTWWLFWAWLGISYLASIVIARDEPE